jgi:predicted nucleic acid-binding protein
MAITRECRVLTDDRDARELARHLRIPLSGTLGVLTRLVDIGHLSLDEADALLLQILVAGVTIENKQRIQDNLQRRPQQSL